MEFKAWISPKTSDVASIIRQYEAGYAGAMWSQSAHEKLLDSVAIRDGDSVCQAFGYADTAAGELVVPYVHVLNAYPGCLPGGGQVEGDCVSWSQRNANLVTLVCESVAGLPDELTGKVEECPPVSDEARRFGVLSTEAIYYFRSTKPGHGWFCAEAASVSRTKAGCVLRQKYGDLDLETYSAASVNAFNRREVTPELADLFDDHVVRQATEVRSFEALRDLLARGFGVTSCGSEGFGKIRDENGVCKRSGSWAHAMAYIGVDDRKWSHEKYGGPLVLLQNSWGEYLTGPKKIHGTDLEIPRGSFWARWSDVAKRQIYAMGGATGWARRKLPDYSPGW